MGTPSEPKPAKYFAGLISPENDLLTTIESDLTLLLGPVEARSEISRWSFSAYYESEMGAGLLRRFVSFRALASPGRLGQIKLATQETENKYRVKSAERSGRRINIDPGYLDSGKVVLASTKNAGHRIYLSSGIYAEATLLYYNGGFQPCVYTYPDFRWTETLSFLARVRASYLEQLSQEEVKVTRFSPK